MLATSLSPQEYVHWISFTIRCKDISINSVLSMDVFCNQYGGSWGKYSHWIFLRLPQIICTRLMMNLNRFESSVPLRKRVIGISQLNSFRLPYWQRDINLNPQHTLKLDKLLRKMVIFQIFFFLNFMGIFQSFSHEQPEILLYSENRLRSNGLETPSIFNTLPSHQVRIIPCNISSTCH